MVKNVGYWENMGMYWAWRLSPNGKPFHRPPTTKKLDYANLGSYSLCIGVWDDDKYTPLNRTELTKRFNWHNK
jgi:hypothetical protein